MATNQQTTVIELPHTLTSDEKLALQGRIIKNLEEKGELKGELETASKEFKRAKADIEKRETELDQTINRLMDENRVGVELRKYRCNIFRNRETHMVEYSVIEGPRAGEVIKTRPFDQEDWAFISEVTQVDIDFSENPDAPDENEIRANADNSGTDDEHSEPAGDAPAGDAAEPTDAADVDKTDLLDNSAGSQGQSEAVDNTDNDDSNDDDDDDDEPSEDDEPQPGDAPKTPKRPAKRTGGPKKK